MRKDCVYEQKCYNHGSSIQPEGDTLVCNDGQWEKEPESRRPGLVIAPGKDLSEL